MNAIPIVVGTVDFLWRHKALVAAVGTAAYLAAHGQYAEALAAIAAAFASGIKSPPGPGPTT